MKLKRHREDVKDLKLQTSAYMHDIAERYRRLILCFEQQYNRSGLITPADIEQYGGPWLKLVLKDAGVK
jgi:hypothetical protein